MKGIKGRKGRRGAAGRGATIRSGSDPQQLLPMALNSHQQGNLARARMLYEQVLAEHPDHGDALQFLGILCHQEGDPGRASELIRKAIATRPGVALYHDNLGTVLESAGRPDEALAEFLAAEAIDGPDPERDYNLGVVLERLGRFEEAEPRYRSALEGRAHDVEVLFGLANTLKALERDEESADMYRRVLEAAPGHTGARTNLGNLLQSSGQLEAAEQVFRAVLEHDPGHAGAWHNLGSVLSRRGHLDEALACFERITSGAVSTDRTVASAAALAKASVLESLGRFDAACAVYRQLQSRPEGGESVRRRLARLLSVWSPPTADAELAALMCEAVEDGLVPAASVARSAFEQLTRAHLVVDLDDPSALAVAAQALAHDPLFVTVATRTANTVPAMERALTRIRAQALRDEDFRQQVAPVLGPLALQCGINEYVLAIAPHEPAALKSLGARLARTLSVGGPWSADLERDLLLYASYASIASLPGACELSSRTGEPASAALAKVLERDLLEPLEEARQRQDIETLAPVRDATSVTVRAQYEESPYPRWQELPRLEAVGVLRALPEATAAQARATLERPGACILVAGAGTGQEALAVARALPGTSITALDLSLASLAHARRMAIVHGVDNVRFVQGDLLDVTALDARFDVIIASGVLHHMAEPRRGLAALLEALAGDGLMKLALYSEHARRAVNAARARIAELGLDPDAAGVRAIRERILDGREPSLAGLLASEDFYALSTCRDLLFHPVEHRFRLPMLAAMLDELRLEFLGFELPHVMIWQRFLARFPSGALDLGCWARFEDEHPDTFAAMYTFWVRRSERSDRA